MRKHAKYLALLLGGFHAIACLGQTISIDKKLYHLRATGKIEWANFKGIPQKELQVTFTAKENHEEQTLGLTQEDVRQKWEVRLNGSSIGWLKEDENSLISYFAIPPRGLKGGKNELTIHQVDSIADDIRVGEILLARSTVPEFLQSASIEITIGSKGSTMLLPARISIVNKDQRLQPVSVGPDPMLAVRTGCIYTGTGKASFHLPPGIYTIYASRGFQYGVDSTIITVKQGDHVKRALNLRKELALEGWISCDTHVHSLTYSGHGDATMAERIVTLAGEGIEFPAITEHNRCVDIDSLARSMNLRQYFTPVAGDEYTTAVGHFNIFPLNPDSTVPDHKVNHWDSIGLKVENKNKDRVIILNHGRDVYNNFRPLDPKRHLSIAGKELDGWKFPANSMEVINSGAQQFDILQLFRDWFGMVNGGHLLTPVGSSDSHDVSRYMVGQGRTYIRYKGNDPSSIDRAVAIRNFLTGDVAISFGLMAELKVDNTNPASSPGSGSRRIMVSIKVLGPSWANADSIFLFANGQLIRSARITTRNGNTIKWQGNWPVNIADQDVFLVAIATGPDPKKPFWRVPNPYQKPSTNWNPRIVGSTGAVWIDADGDGKNSTANEYAADILSRHPGKIEAIIEELGRYDETVSVQASILLKDRGLLPATDRLNTLLTKATPAVQKGFRSYKLAICTN